MQNPYLPDGCTDKDVDRHMGSDIDTETCDECDGLGHTGSECCGKEIDDKGHCKKCNEYAEFAKCEKCGGEGWIEFSIEDRQREAKEEAEINRFEINRLDD